VERERGGLTRKTNILQHKITQERKQHKIEPHTHTHTTRTNKKPNSPQKKRSCSCFHPSLRQEKRDEEYDDDDDDVEHAAQHSRG